MTSNVIKYKAMEQALTGNTCNTVSNGSLIRVIASVNTFLYVVNNSVNTGGMTVLSGTDYWISKYPQDLMVANNGNVLATSVAFRE
jgi:uncharacterized membrane protein